MATHPRAPRPGVRVTQPDHRPPEQIPGAFWTRESCRVLAAAVGPATTRLVETLLADPVLDRLPRVMRVLKRRERVGRPRLEAACARALHDGDRRSRTLTRILDQGLEAAPLRVPPAPVPASTFVRPAAERLGALVGGAPWSSTTSERHTLQQRRLSGVLATLDARHRQAIDGQGAYVELLERWLEDEIERRAQKQLA